jgi:1,4-dihydroxy-2-naphthoate polyprenyltransferase
MPTVSDWVNAARPRTLPLSLSSILMGCFLASAESKLSWPVAILACLTTIFLQVLSNFANDYGDAVNGKDTDARQGPMRAVQSGAISANSMRKAMIVFVVLSLVCGIWLLYEAFKNGSLQTFLVFLGLGVAAIIAAITYTAGKNPYGYAGLGDISVLIFFGWIGVMGTYYLHTLTINWTLLLPASSCGLFAVGVLNINNIRDIESDTITGKRSIPVRIGRNKAVVYHWVLLILGMVFCVSYIATQNQISLMAWLPLLSFPLFIYNGLSIAKNTKASAIDPYLKQMALSTLLFVVLFGISVTYQ